METTVTRVLCLKRSSDWWSDDRFKHETRVTVVSISICFSLYMYLYQALLQLCETTAIFLCLIHDNKYNEECLDKKLNSTNAVPYCSWLSRFWIAQGTLLPLSHKEDCSKEWRHYSWTYFCNSLCAVLEHWVYSQSPLGYLQFPAFQM